MKMELLILLITGFFILNTYYDGKYMKMLLSWKKYYQMFFFGMLGLGLYWMMKKNPAKCKNMLYHANNVVKFMPFDRSSIDMIQPIFDFTSSKEGSGYFMEQFENQTHTNTLQQGGSQKPTKRSVSETKKKFVASQQNWRCGQCKEQLNHTFEVDHKIRLEYGGSNEVDNLVALCRNCHGSKTAMENM